MIEQQTETKILQEVIPPRLYSTTVLKVAQHKWYTHATNHVLDVTDALQAQSNIFVLAVVDADNRVLGIIRREALFALVGKPFGREVLQRSHVTEIMEKVPVFEAHTDVFAVAQRILNGVDSETATSFYPLVDNEHRLQGILAAQDLLNYLSRITQNDIELAGSLQERLLSSSDLSEEKGIEAWSRAAKGVGGDFYYVQELGTDKVFSCLCDVSGKGLAASLIVSMVWGLLRGYDYRRGLKELIITLNRSVITTFHLEKYLTGFFSIYDRKTRRLICADMGHSHTLLIRGHRCHPIRSISSNLPIGIEMDIQPSILSVILKLQDSLFVFSDGITEQENPDGLEFGENRLHKVLQGCKEEDCNFKKGIPAAIDDFRMDTPQGDDMSFLILKAI